MQAEEFDQELLKRLKAQRKLLEETSLNVPLSSLNGNGYVKITKKKKKAKKDEPSKRKKRK